MAFLTPGVFLLLAATVGVAAFVQGTVGMGFALLVVPVCGLVAPELVPVALLVLMLPLNGYVAWRERSHLDLRGAGWITAGCTVGALLGLWILATLTRGHLNLLIGGSTVLAGLASLGLPAFEPGRKALLAAGVATGVTETATGIGGPPLALVYQHRRAPVLRSTLALCFAAGELISLTLYGLMGLLSFRVAGTAAALLPFLALGAWLSRHAHPHVEGRLLRTAVIVFAVVSGAWVILKAIHRPLP